MRQTNALGLKLIAYLAIFGVTMPFFGDLTLPQSLILAMVNTLVLWFADLLILPRLGMMAALIGDLITLLLLSLMTMGAMLAYPTPLGLTLALTLAGLFEWQFHRWLLMAES